VERLVIRTRGKTRPNNTQELLSALCKERVHGAWKGGRERGSQHGDAAGGEGGRGYQYKTAAGKGAVTQEDKKQKHSRQAYKTTHQTKGRGRAFI